MSAILLKAQNEIGANTEKAYKSFKEALPERRNQAWLAKRMSELEAAWVIFESNHQELELDPTADPSGSYFANGYYRYIRSMYEEYKKALAELMLTGGKDSGDDLGSRARNHNSQIQALKRLIKQWQDLAAKGEVGDIGMQEGIRGAWKIVQNMHAQLMQHKDYDASTYFSVEADAISVMGKIPDITPATGGHAADGIRVPKITLPTFSGNYLQWKAFQELFEKLIGRKNLSGIEKMMYLKQNLQGDAAKVIQHMELTEDNYASAWDALQKRYNNRRLIVSSIFDRIFNLDNVRPGSAESIKRCLDTLLESVNALKAMGFDTEGLNSAIMNHFVVKKLDSTSRSLYEQGIKAKNDPQELPGLLVFLEERFRELETTKQTTTSQSGYPQKARAYGTTLLSTEPGDNTKLCGCKEQHPLYKCKIFMGKKVTARMALVKNKGACMNCLEIGHGYRQCESTRRCKQCKRTHHSLLHFGGTAKAALFGSAVGNKGISHVFLATAIVEIPDINGKPIKARALLDSGSQLNIMTERLGNQLRIKQRDTSAKISGLGAAALEAKKRAVIKVQSKHCSFKADLEVFVVKKLTTCQPSQKIDVGKWKIPNNVSLADPEFNVPASIDLIIGGGLFYKMLSVGLISIGDKLPDLQNTVLGWVVTGELLGLQQNNPFVGLGVQVIDNLEKQVAEFWKLEEKDCKRKQLTDLEKECELTFQETTIQQKVNGKFLVRLQFTKEPDVLGQSEHMALRRFNMLERKLGRNEQLRSDYVKFMREYEQMGHMELVKRKDLGDKFYVIPHHAVLNPGSSTTKLRVVFDASAKTTTNIALNEILANGPMLQDDLFSIMVRFRKHAYVFSSDIAKMYRQVEIHPMDRNWQVIVWREKPEDRINYYRLKTVTYGTTCASYLAIKTLQHLADLNQTKYPQAAVVAKRDFNVDDVMTGCDNLEEALETQRQLLKMLAAGKMELHKWCANHERLLDNISTDKQEVSLEINAEKTETKALGMKWIPKTDVFMLHYNQREHAKITKRTVLSETAQLFDPLGLVNPVIVLAKIFLQRLWALKLDWDAALPQEMHSQWIKFREELSELNKVVVPRHMIAKNAKNVQLHAFSDASTRAYGTAIYIRSEDASGMVTVQLVCSKSRVAPVSATTLPRLELCAGVTMVELVKKLEKVLDITFDKIVHWTDSEVVLSWLYEDGSYKTFVANRVAQIKRSTEVSSWRYINTKENPADLVSRGVWPKVLLQSTLWWHGPEFLKEKEDQWPLIKPEFRRAPDEERKVKTALTATLVEGENMINRINHRNSFETWKRILGYCLRFWKMCKDKATYIHHGTELSIQELRASTMTLLRFCQKETFAAELKDIRKGAMEKTKLVGLAPFIDEDGLMRVGGRLKAADIPEHQKHPILLPKDHEMTKMIMEKVHRDNMHAGPQALLAITRQKYWPLNGKRVAQSIVKSCILCARAKPKLMSQVMGDLPRDRLTIARPFQCVGVDFAGPIMIHYKIRGKRPTKAYVCIFVCFTTKAVHIEAAADLSTDAFMSCLKRFIARRGLPSKIHCDNGTNFVGAKNQLQELAQLMKRKDHQQNVTRYCQDHGIEWSFIPPRSPHFGGLWEAAVKSAKHHLTRITYGVDLTFDELATILAEIEAILNSRPLTALSSDPNDMQPLTAGHFLIGAPMNAINEEELKHSPATKMWFKLKMLRRTFWDRWSKEFLADLQNRAKWTTGHENVQIGALVIIKDENAPPLTWKMARVMHTTKDQNGTVRVVTLRTPTGVLKRAVHQIAELPIDQEETKFEVEFKPEMVKEKSKLRATADPFQSKKTQASSERRPKTTTKKKSGRKAHAPEASHESRTTRSMTSKRCMGKTGLIAWTILALIMLIVGTGATNTGCNTTNFTHNPGVYFEPVGQMSLSNGEWDIMCYMKLSDYWKEQEDIEIILRQMEKACPEVHPDDYCSTTMGHFKHQSRALKMNNEIILGFNNEPRKRVKRAWFNGIGVMQKEVFGVMDEDDAMNIETQIKQLDANEGHLMELIKNQSTIQEITKNIIKRDETVIQNQMKYMRTQIEDLTNKNTIGKANVFTALSVQALTVIGSYRETQKIIIDMLTQMNNGHVPPLLITPEQLRKQLSIITSYIANNLMIPGSGHENIAKFYAVLTAKVRITDNNLLINVKVPILSREFFKLFKAIPVPYVENGMLKQIKTQADFIGITARQDRYYILSAFEKDRCKIFNEEQWICKQIQPIYNVVEDEESCEIAIKTQRENAFGKCTALSRKETQIWTMLVNSNGLIFAVKNTTTIFVICKEVTTTCVIEGSGILQLQPQCTVKSGFMELAPNNMKQTSMNVNYDQETNISKFIGTMKPQGQANTGLDWDNLDKDLEWQRLNIAIAHEKSEEQLTKLNFHDIHHYTWIYLWMTAGLIVGIVIARKRWIERKKNQQSINDAAKEIMFMTPMQPLGASKASRRDQMHQSDGN